MHCEPIEYGGHVDCSNLLYLKVLFGVKKKHKNKDNEAKRKKEGVRAILKQLLYINYNTKRSGSCQTLFLHTTLQSTMS